MVTRCFRKGCNFSEEAAHMDDAIDRLRQHHRAVHPTKVFYENDYAANLETYNLTVDEIIESNDASRPGAEQPYYDWRHIRAQAQRWRQQQDRGNVYIKPETLDELEQRVTEWFANQPQEQAQEAAPPANPFGQARLVMDELALPEDDGF